MLKLARGSAGRRGENDGLVGCVERKDDVEMIWRLFEVRCVTDLQVYALQSLSSDGFD